MIKSQQEDFRFGYLTNLDKIELTLSPEDECPDLKLVIEIYLDTKDIYKLSLRVDQIQSLSNKNNGITTRFYINNLNYTLKSLDSEEILKNGGLDIEDSFTPHSFMSLQALKENVSFIQADKRNFLNAFLKDQCLDACLDTLESLL